MTKPNIKLLFKTEMHIVQMFGTKTTDNPARSLAHYFGMPTSFLYYQLINKCHTVFLKTNRASWTWKMQRPLAESFIFLYLKVNYLIQQSSRQKKIYKINVCVGKSKLYSRHRLDRNETIPPLSCLHCCWLSQIQLGEKIIHIACILMSCYRPIIFFRLSTEMKLYFCKHG